METFDKYKALRNFIHNELGITKEDIRVMVQEAVHNSVETHAKRILADGNIINAAVVKAIQKEIDGYGYGARSLQESITQLLVKELQKKIGIDVRIK